MSNFTEKYKNCNLCARKCSADRTKGELGFCKSTADMKITRASLHFWEEPVISGTEGSGAIFFSGCSLGCIFCQNREISRGLVGDIVTVEELSQIMLTLESQKANNINLVTPTHFVPSIIESVKLAREKGLKIPIVYNTGSYDTKETIESLKGTVDVYLPDFKYYKEKTASKLSFAKNYVEVCKEAIDEMVNQTGGCRIENGIMTRGVIVRILLLPEHVAEAKLSVKYLYEKYGDKIYLSLMNQYTPMDNMLPPLNRSVTHREYEELVEYAVKIGVKNGFTQEYGTVSESFIPKFDGTGIQH